MPLQNKPLWHIDNFKLKILEKTTDAEGLFDLLFFCLKVGHTISHEKVLLPALVRQGQFYHWRWEVNAEMDVYKQTY